MLKAKHLLTKLSLVAFFIAAVGACEGLPSKKKEDSEKSGADATQSADANNESLGPDGEVPVEQNEQAEASGLTANGLPSFCTMTPATASSEQACFTCTPRELPLHKCAKLPVNFNPKNSCIHDLDRLSCYLADLQTLDYKSKPDFEFDLQTETNSEDLLNKTPVFILVAKAVVADKFKDKPEVKSLVSDALDLIEKNKISLFTGDNAEQVAGEVVALAKKKKPSMSQASQDAVHDQVITAMTKIKEKRPDDVKIDDMLGSLSGILAELPGDGLKDLPGMIGGWGPLLENAKGILGGGAGNGLDLGKLLESLQETNAASESTP
jgi:hypothetical protein